MEIQATTPQQRLFDDYWKRARMISASRRAIRECPLHLLASYAAGCLAGRADDVTLRRILEERGDVKVPLMDLLISSGMRTLVDGWELPVCSFNNSSWMAEVAGYPGWWRSGEKRGVLFVGPPRCGLSISLPAADPESYLGDTIEEYRKLRAEADEAAEAEVPTPGRVLWLRKVVGDASARVKRLSDARWAEYRRAEMAGRAPRIGSAIEYEISADHIRSLNYPYLAEEEQKLERGRRGVLKRFESRLSGEVDMLGHKVARRVLEACNLAI